MDNQLCKCGKVGEISCPHDERCGNDNTSLPAEVLEQIKKDAEIYQEHRTVTAKRGYIAGATQYAIKLHQTEQDISQLKRWKMEAAELLTPINAYVHKHIEKSLDQCCVKLVLERCKQFEQARTLLEKFISRHEACWVVDEELFNEIKTFLDGNK